MNALKASRIVTWITVGVTIGAMGVVFLGLLREPGAHVIIGFFTLVITAGWTSGPYFLADAGAKARKDWRGAWIFPVASALAAVSAIAIYVITFFFSKPDGQAGLIFLIIPVYQYALVIAVHVIAAVIDRKQPAAPA